MYHTSTGTIHYDPYRGGMKNKVNWWAVCDVDREITRYYRWWVKKEFWIDLAEPSWNAHISIIRGEKPRPELMHLWKEHDRKKVQFEYTGTPYRCEHKKGGVGHFWVVDVECPELIQIRKDFGLKHDWPLHLTIGRSWY